MRPSRPVLSILLFAFVTVLSPACLAQLPQASDTTSPPTPGVGHDYLGGPAETVNPANGSVSIRIPVRIPSGRQLTIPLSIAYDSAGAFYYGQSQLNEAIHWATIPSMAFSQGGWSYTLPLLTHSQQTWTAQSSNGKNLICTEAVNYVFQDPTGNRHNMGLAVNTSIPSYMPWCGGSGPSILQGGEGPILATTSQSTQPPVTVTDGNGTTYSLSGTPQTITDRNGNTISISRTSNSASVTDTLGRTAINVGSFGGNPDSISVAGLASPYQVSWTTASANFTMNSIQLPTGSCPGSMSGSASAASQVVLPNGQKYIFTYDATYGMLNKMTYPSGGYVRYVWGLNSQAEAGTWGFPDGNGGIIQVSCRYDFPAITDRYVSFDGTTEVLHQHFSYSTSWPSGSVYYTSKTTTVTTTDLIRNTNFNTVYTYSPVNTPPVIDLNPNSPSGYVGYTTQQIPVEQTIQYNGTTGSLLRTVTKSWLNNNPRLLGSEQTTLDNGQSSLVVNCYNTDEQLTETDSYDLGASAPTLPACASGVPSGTVAGPLLRKTTKTYATFTAAHIVDLPSTVISYDGSGNRVAETDYSYDSPAGTVTSGIVQHGTGCNCGNLTVQSQWLNSSGTKLTTNFTNDDTGQRLSMTNPRNNQTTYSYTDSYSSGTPPGPTNAYLTTVTHPQTSGVNHIEKFAYAYASGEVTSSTDQNNLVTTYKYVDNLARLTETDFPDGGVTTIAYNDAAYNPSTPSPSVTTTKKINTSTNLVTVSAMDGLGHTVRSELTSDPQGTVYTDTAYDGLARVYTVSNPYRSGTDPTTSSGTTTYGYDALSRKTSETYPDNSVLTTAYCAGSTLVTDPTGKWRRSRVDGLGRLVEVDEPNAVGATVSSTGCPGTGEPIWVTSYTVDTLGNLKNVVQNGTHQRIFAYDFLSRLLTANSPESGSITYNYDSDASCAGANSFPGLLVSKVDARSIRTCAQYDALNRETVLNYSNGDPTITTTYDQSACLGLTACQNIGQRTSVTDAAGSEAWSYQVDATNHRSVHVNQRTTNSSPSNITKTSTYYLDLAGNVTQAVYPTGRVVNYTYDAADRPSGAADTSNGITYAAGPDTSPGGTCTADVTCYTPQGTFYALSIGETASFTGLNLTHIYNSRLQPLEFKASSTGGNAIDITYSFVDPSTLKNAGHVYSITNNLDSTRSQTFSYDQLNRITSALTTSTHATSPTHCWGETYSADAWGNLQSIAATTNSNYTGCSQESGFAKTADGNNHLSGFTYDASGNTQNDGVNSYTWDAESQLKSGGGVNYLYDGDGRRVSKVGSKLYWYGSGGDILAETDASGNTTAEYIFFGGQRIAMLPASGNPIYYVEDLLGTSRVITTNTGVVCYDADFYPYGGERSYTSTCPQNYKFEGKERDTETGNDDFGARYYSNRFGRWLSADWSSVPAPVPYANLTNPQTLNLYSMVSDDPESFADLDGHCGTTILPGAPPVACPENTPHAIGEAATQAAQPQEQNQVPPEVKAAIAASLKASNSPTADDKKGGFHEEGGVWGSDIKTANTVVSPAKSGPVSNPGDKDAHMQVGNAVNPALNQQMMPQGEWHIHPKGSGDRQFVQPPSGADKTNAVFKTNIVVGAGNNRVYVYNSSGVIREMSLKQFMKEP